jgi:hypothetical protein
VGCFFVSSSGPDGEGKCYKIEECGNYKDGDLCEAAPEVVDGLHPKGNRFFFFY